MNYEILVIWPWPWSNDLGTQTWPRYYKDVCVYQKWSSYLQWFKSYHLNRQTDRQTHRQTQLKLLPTAYVDGNKGHFYFKWQQECIPVGCVPPAHYCTGWCPWQTPLDRNPLDRDPPGQRPLWTETPHSPGKRPPRHRPPKQIPWTKTTQTETALDRDLQTETPLTETENLPCGQTNTSENTTFPQLSLRAVIMSTYFQCFCDLCVTWMVRFLLKTTFLCRLKWA